MIFSPTLVPGRDADDVRLTTVAGLKQRYAISPTVAYELMNEGKIESLKLGRRRLIDVQSVERFIATLRQADASTAHDDPNADVRTDLRAPPERSL
jgi:hypothetical protein